MMVIMEFHKYKISGNHLTNIYIKGWWYEQIVNQKSILWTNCSNEANNENDHNIIIITFCLVERSHMMATEKQCMVVKMNKICYLVISSKIKKWLQEVNAWYYFVRSYIQGRERYEQNDIFKIRFLHAMCYSIW